MFIDADAHIDENPDTWSYFPEKLSNLRPAELVIDPEQIPNYLSKNGPRGDLSTGGWLIDGRIYRRAERSDEQTHTTADIRHLRDIVGRLNQMDKLDIESQVLFPTLLASEITDRPEVDIALCESYNRWIADRCSESNGRLKWLAVVPTSSMDATLKEMKRVKEAGAIGVTKRPLEADWRRAGAPHFHPMYELAQELDMPVCMHIGQPFFGFAALLTVTRPAMKADFFVLDAFLSMVVSKTYEKFPRVRFGFIEASSAWIPYILHIAKFNESHRGHAGTVTVAKDAPLPTWKDFMETTNLFVTCDATENIGKIVSEVGDENLVLGTDYGHSDRSSILYGHREVTERRDISKETAKKLTETNARRLYGLA